MATPSGCARFGAGGGALAKGDRHGAKNKLRANVVIMNRPESATGRPWVGIASARASASAPLGPAGQKSIIMIACFS